VKSTWLAIALAKAGRRDEAAQVIQPAVALDRELSAKNHGAVWVAVELAGALYAQALADQKQRAALLLEAARLLDAAAPSLRATHDVRQLREMVRTAAAG
jgi:hypothetical protein